MGKIGALTLAPGDQQDIAPLAHTIERRDGGANIGTLGVVDVTDPGDLGHPLAAVWQAAEPAQGRHHTHQRQSGRMPQRQRRQCIGDVMSTHQPQFAAGQQRIETVADVFPAGRINQAKPRQFRLAHTPADHFHVRPHQRNGQWIVAVDHRFAAAAKNTVLGLVIAGHGTVPVQVIRAHIQYSGDCQLEIPGPLKLEAGQLEHVQCAVRVQQIECRRAQVAANTHIQPGVPRHLAQQFSHRRLGIGPGDTDHRCGGLAHKQVDVTDDTDTGRPRLLHHRCVHRHTGAYHQFGCAGYQFRRIRPGVDRDVRHRLPECPQPRRFGAGIHHAEGQAALVEVAGAGHTGDTQAHHDPVHAACNHALCHVQSHPR